MTYESLKSTLILATHCAICARPLRDAVSVEIGIGPDCREKYGYAEGVTDENRAQANQLIYRVCDAKGDKISVFDAAAELASLGFAKLAFKLQEGLTSLIMTREGDTLKLASPYSAESVEILRSVPGRRWDKAGKVNTFPITSRGALWSALKRAYPGQLLRTWQGALIAIPSLVEFNARADAKINKALQDNAPQDS